MSSSNDVRDYKKFKGGIRLSKKLSDPSTNEEEGAIIYNSTEQSLKVRNANGWSAVGGGSGGSLDTFYTEDFSTTPKTDFTAATISIDDLSIETSSPIDSNSLKFSQSGTTAGTILHTAGIVPTLKQKGNTCSIAFWYTYDGNDDDIKVLVKSTDGSGVTTISAGTDLLKTATTTKKFTTTFTIPSDSTKIQWGFEIVTGVSNKILLIDDVEMSQDPFVQSNLGSTNPHIITPAKSNLTDWTDYIPVDAQQGFGSITDKDCRWRRVGDSMELHVEFITGTIPSGPSETGQFKLPTGYTIDSTKMTDLKIVGGAIRNVVSSDSIRSIFPIAEGGADHIKFGYYGDTENTPLVNTSVSSEWAAGNKIFSFFATVPITGWSAQDSNFLAALPMTKWKSRQLEHDVAASDAGVDEIIALDGTVASGHTTTGDDFNLSYDNLSTSKTYRISWSVGFYVNNAEAAVELYKDDLSVEGNLLARTVGVIKSGGSTPHTHDKQVYGMGGQYIVTGVTALKFRASSLDDNDQIKAAGTWSTLEELPMHEDAGTIWD